MGDFEIFVHIDNSLFAHLTVQQSSRHTVRTNYGQKLGQFKAKGTKAYPPPPPEKRNIAKILIGQKLHCQKVPRYKSP